MFDSYTCDILKTNILENWLFLKNVFSTIIGMSNFNGKEVEWLYTNM